MKRLLVVKLSSIGDILHALPVVKSIKQDLPDLYIGWVVRERCAGLLAGCEFIDDVHIVKNRPGFVDLLKLRRQLLRQNYDTAFDMQGLLLSGLIAFLSGARHRIGLNRNREFNTIFLTDSSVEGKKPLTHAVDVQLGFRGAAGLQPIAELPMLSHLGRASESWVLNIKLADAGGKTVVLNVGASTIYKRWPIESWIGLGNALIDWGCHVVITAGPAESADAALIASGIQKSGALTNLGGITTSDQLAAILGHCDLVVTGDTGPMHLAAALGTPTIALFGPTDPRLTGPYGSQHRVIWKHISCSPCFRHPTCNGRVDCLKSISAVEVYDEAVSRLTLPAAAAH